MSSPARYQPIAQSPAPRTDISQATAVEQSRAIAEVQASVFVAKQSPRIKDMAVAEMRDSTAQKSVGDKAFFRFPRGGQTVTGPSVHLARELARCWGNINYGVIELRRDDEKGESEMQAYAWDLETNTRNAQTFIVPHKRDQRSGPQKLTDMRDIYENNANAGARRVREAIFAVLPSWFIDEAVDRCNETIKKGGGVPLPQRIANSIGHFEGIGVTRAQLESKIGRPSDKWNEHDVSQLGVTFSSINRGEVTRDEEFPPARVTAGEIASTVKSAEKPEPAEKSAEEPVKPGEPA
ncbi:V-type ATPase subunit [Rhodococcus qingshengii]|uniref:hypothetical protein n=1 Tax=Rhodococcus qingshengii TaxID=334542 RepID=UPI0022048109|nr:hypothetical protein [Rhodococcus qingshengii]BDQ19729.1 V-type ATPase subunit [Rhodococcus qingshengii]